jgi:hypothetical protein
MASVDRIELPVRVLETPVLPLHYTEMARPAGIEPATHGLEGRCSIL